MKILLTDNDGFKTYAELEDCANPDTLKILRIYTYWDNAKYPQNQVKCELFLTDEARKSLIELLK